MRRRLFAVASAVSLLLCLATVGLWVRSFRLGISCLYEDRGGYGSVALAWGRLVCMYQPSATSNPSPSPHRWHFNIPLETAGYDYIEGGGPTEIRSGHYFTSMAHDMQWWSTPMWWLPASTTFICVILHLPLLRRRKHLPGQCPSCDYPLTGNASSVCPECGTPVVQVSEGAG